ncbi:MAG TPA: Ig-like domain-containing protein [Hyphomicrobiaceae bacterium]|nr:Ig-like domain-containing protein [Hyphomicrobiaceae bacterium]
MGIVISQVIAGLTVIGLATSPALAQEQPAKAAAHVELSVANAPTEVGQTTIFKAAVSGPAGVPTGSVTFKDGVSVLGGAELSAGGRAALETSQLALGEHAITATYAGDGSYAEAVSAELRHTVLKAAAAVRVAAAPGRRAGETTLTASVNGAGRAPTGGVTFKADDGILGSAPVADGLATLTVASLPAGRHEVAATYGGDDRYRESTAPAIIYVVQAPPAAAPRDAHALIVLVLTVIAAGLLVLLRRIAFRWLLRPLGRALRRISRAIGRVVRLGGETSVKQKPVKSFLGLSVGTLAEAFSETDDAIAADFDKATVRIDPQTRLACTWLRPALSYNAEYHRDDADGDFISAKHLFSTVVPLGSNPLNLYDDIHNAFIVNLLGKSDKGCFYVLSEFRRVINSNVLVLAGIFSLIVSLVAVANLTASTLIDFYHGLGLENLPPVTDGMRLLGLSQEDINKGLFGLASCAAGYLLMWMFYHMAYDQAQRHNGREMDNLLVGYLANISIRFNKIHASATQAVVGDADVNEMKRETVLWITDLHWMAFRVFFIEEFLRSILFQIRRNSIYALFLVPAFFIVLMVGAAYVFGVRQFNIFDLESGVYRQNSFYVLFPALLYAYYKYLIDSLNPMSESIEGKWSTFRDLNVVDAMSRIMESYAVQLDQWRSRFKQGPGGGM